MIVNMVQPLTRPILSSLTDAITAALGGFNPRSLFSAGEQGVIYDLSDSTTLFADSAGTTPAAVNGPVGLVLDKSQGLVLGAESMPQPLDLTNAAWNTVGTLSATTANSFTNASGAGAGKSYAVTTGKWYQVSIPFTKSDGSTLFGAYDGGTPLPISTSSSASGTLTAIYRATDRFYLRLAGNATVTIGAISVKEIAGNHAYQTTATSRPTLRGTPTGLDGDGADDALLCASSGGGTTGFLFQAATRPDVINKRQTLWSDAGANTGYKVELNASNQLVFSAGNGSAYTSVTTANTVAAGTTYSVECYDDGTNLVAILNEGTPATAARPTVSAGTAGFTMQKDNGAASGFMDGVLYSAIYLRNTAKNSTTRAASMRWIRQKAGL